MKNKETDYEKLYRDSLLTLSEKESILSEKDDIIADLGFELDKLRRYIFGFKSEKHNGSAGDNQMSLFELVNALKDDATQPNYALDEMQLLCTGTKDEEREVGLEDTK
jgi:hypothetical protein